MRFGSRGLGVGSRLAHPGPGRGFGPETGRRKWRPSHIRQPWGRSERCQGDSWKARDADAAEGRGDKGPRARVAGSGWRLQTALGTVTHPVFPGARAASPGMRGREGSWPGTPKRQPRGHCSTPAPALGGPRPPGGGDRQGPQSSHSASVTENSACSQTDKGC